MRVAISHNLTRAEARKRIKARTDEIVGFIPGASSVRSEWEGKDHLALTIAVMGKEVDAGIDIEDDEIVIEIELPRSLALFSSKIKSAIRDKGTKLLG
ncbi:MAG: polyhydroxyalkanoic acid system family protein [Novosphingobium sp.]